jgi:hypothetical protein
LNDLAIARANLLLIGLLIAVYDFAEGFAKPVAGFRNLRCRAGVLCETWIPTK